MKMLNIPNINLHIGKLNVRNKLEEICRSDLEVRKIANGNYKIGRFIPDTSGVRPFRKLDVWHVKLDNVFLGVEIRNDLDETVMVIRNPEFIDLAHIFLTLEDNLIRLHGEIPTNAEWHVSTLLFERQISSQEEVPLNVAVQFVNSHDTEMQIVVRNLESRIVAVALLDLAHNSPGDHLLSIEEIQQLHTVDEEGHIAAAIAAMQEADPVTAAQGAALPANGTVCGECHSCEA